MKQTTRLQHTGLLRGIKSPNNRVANRHVFPGYMPVFVSLLLPLRILETRTSLKNLLQFICVLSIFITFLFLILFK